MRPHARISVLVLVLSAGLSLHAQVNIPEWPGDKAPADKKTTTAPSSTAAKPQSTSSQDTPSQSVPAQSGDAAAMPASLETSTWPKLSAKEQERALKDQEKETRKHEKEEEKKHKEAEEESKFLKIQGGEIVAPTLDADGNTITLSPCSKKDKECQKKRKALLNRKKLGMKVDNGTLTVDGWTGKARLNYDITEVKFLYFYAPGVGTTVISTERFPGSVEQKNAFSGKTLNVNTPDGHNIQLSSEKPMIKAKSESAWVAVDMAYNLNSRYPVFGYGSTARAPYNWPGARPMTEEQKKVASKTPPLPNGLEARQMVLPCVNVKSGEKPQPIKINGIMMTPPVCAAKLATPNAYNAGEVPPDGSGAASTGVPEKH